MFEELLKLATRRSSGAEQLDLWGREAAKRYLEEGIPLTEFIQKTAGQHSLNGEEIRRVCEAANLETYSHLLKQADPHDKTFEFQVADPARVLAPERPAEKTAGPAVFDTDYDRRPDSDLLRTAGVDLAEVFGYAPPLKVAEDRPRAEALLQHLEFLAKEAQDKLAVNFEDCLATAGEFYKYVRQEVLDGRTLDEVRDFVEARAAAAELPVAQRIRELLDYACRRMIDEGLVREEPTGGSAIDREVGKTAAPVGPELLTDTWESPGVPIQVINGRHPLCAVLDTLVRQFEEADALRDGIWSLNDRAFYVKKRIRGL